MRFSTLPILVSALCFFFSLPTFSLAIKRQAPNTVGSRNAAATASFNTTFYLLPIPKATALDLLPKDLSGKPRYSLTAPTGLPSGFIDPVNQHLLFINFGYEFDIKQGSVGLGTVTLDQLSVANVYVPFVDLLGSGKPFLYNTVSFVDFLLSSIVGTLATRTNTQKAQFDPPHAAYKLVGDSDFSFTITQGVDVSRIGVENTVFQTVFHNLSTPYISADTFKSIAAQPYLKTSGSPASGCDRVTFLYNETFADPFFTSGSASVSSPILPSTTTYPTVYGYSVGAEWISPLDFGKPCSSFV